MQQQKKNVIYIFWNVQVDLMFLHRTLFLKLRGNTETTLTFLMFRFWTSFLFEHTNIHLEANKQHNLHNMGRNDDFNYIGSCIFKDQFSWMQFVNVVVTSIDWIFLTLLLNNKSNSDLWFIELWKPKNKTKLEFSLVYSKLNKKSKITSGLLLLICKPGSIHSENKVAENKGNFGNLYT